MASRWIRCLYRHTCPRCGDGAVFGTLLRMHRACPACGLEFEREPGYFLGAMYFSYALAVACAAPLVLLGLWRGWSIPVIGWSATALLAKVVDRMSDDVSAAAQLANDPGRRTC